MTAHRSAAVTALVWAVWIQSCLAAPEIHDYLTQPWYATEVIVFQRAEVMEFNTVERLVTVDVDPLPASMRTLNAVPAQMNMIDRLDPVMRAAMALPTPSVDQIPDVGVDEPPEEPEPPWPRGAAPPVIHPVLEPHPLLEFMAAVGRFESQLPAQSHRWLPADTLALAAESKRLGRQSGYRVLFHNRWLQPIPPREEPQPVFIQAGMEVGDQFQLEGTIGVTLGRYLHFQADLTYREPGLGLSPVYLPVGADGAAVETSLPSPRAGVMMLSESRRMRSGETHYLDHPKLGVIVRIEHVPLPDDLVAQFESLQEPSD